MENNLTLTIFLKRSLSQIEIEDMEHDFNIKLYHDVNFDQPECYESVNSFAYSINGSLKNVSRFLEFKYNNSDTALHFIA
jgi:hypothetical protein